MALRLVYLVMTMSEPKLTTLSVISFWKPVTMAIEIIITASPKVIPAMAILTMGRVPEIVLLSACPPARMRRFAIKNEVFNCLP